MFIVIVRWCGHRHKSLQPKSRGSYLSGVTLVRYNSVAYVILVLFCQGKQPKGCTVWTMGGPVVAGWNRCLLHSADLCLWHLPSIFRLSGPSVEIIYRSPSSISWEQWWFTLHLEKISLIRQLSYSRWTIYVIWGKKYDAGVQID